ncbi:hypothetical protein [uncultured Gimesia sp.]|uniref:hypothetical protein n=1 Tax=uncultured Gimesia sp. TaxID=1678688 RepID=UPI0030DBC46D|tara:strand:+ start:349721 stop:350002 length:282 start_codon:yes stop_codon:yes gene_type:complete
MQELMISPQQDQFKIIRPAASALDHTPSAVTEDSSQNLSISVLEWLNSELRKEVEKQEIVDLQSNEKMIDRLQHMLTSKATGITIMVAGLFLM